MIKYIKWICLIAALIGICILDLTFIKNNPKTEELEEDIFKINKIQSTAWYKTKEEIYENNELKYNTPLNEPEYIIFLKNKIQHDNPLTNQINYYNYEYKNNIIIIHESEEYLPAGSYTISLENEQLKLTQKEKNQLKVYYFTKAAG